MNQNKTHPESNWTGDGIPELQTELSDVIELVPPRVKIDIKRYNELIRKELILDITVRILSKNPVYSEMLKDLFGDNNLPFDFSNADKEKKDE